MVESARVTIFTEEDWIEGLSVIYMFRWMLMGHQEKMSAWSASVLCTCVACLFLVVVPSTAWSLTWSGGAAVGSSGWSSGANWTGTAPSLSEPFRLEFPRLLNPACTSASPSDTCYTSKNDVGDVAVESLRVDDGDEYELGGDGITLGSEGLVASPASGSSGPAGDLVGLPIELGASQAWDMAGRSSDAIGENGVLMEGAVTGSDKSLAVGIENGAVLYLHNDLEVGSLTFAGADLGEAGALNGFVGLLGAQVNSSDDNTVLLSHVAMLGSGSIGALTTSDAELGVGSGYPTGGIEARSATFDAGSEVEFEITGTGVVADSDYGRLSSAGPVSLGGATVSVFVAPTSGSSCPTPSPGAKYAFVSTNGALTGAFGNAAEGAEIPVRFSKNCSAHPSTHLRIAYHRNGSLEAVTGTVPGGTEVSEPEQKYNPYVREEDPIEWGAVSGARLAESNARGEAERLARTVQESMKPTVTTALSLSSHSFPVQGNGMALVKLKCSASQSCAGQLTLSTHTTLTGKRKRQQTRRVGTATFSIPANETTTVEIKLNTSGRALLRTSHGHLNASLTIRQSTPDNHSQVTSVHLHARRLPLPRSTRQISSRR